MRLFPREVVLTVQTLFELHALSEILTTAMGQAVPDGPLDLRAYTTGLAGRGAPGRP